VTTLAQVLTEAGFTGNGLAIAEGVATAESGANATAHNGNAATGDNSYGLFQINMLGSMGPARLAEYGLSSDAALFDPLTNAKVAFKMSAGGTNWGPWTTFTSGAYAAFQGVNKVITNIPSGSSPVTGTAPTGASTTTPGAATPAINLSPSGLLGDLTGSVGTAIGGLLSSAASAIGADITKALIVAAAVAGGAGLVILGVNKAAGNPAGKGARAAAPAAAAAML
jgi:Lysozyme like domain